MRNTPRQIHSRLARLGLLGLLAIFVVPSGVPGETTSATDAPHELWDPSRPVPLAAEAPLLDDVRFAVIKQREIAAEGFWPCDEPTRMADGNWIVAGMDIPDGPTWANPAVAISHGDDFSRWDTVRIPVPEELRTVWGETTVTVEPDEILAIARPGWKHDRALISTSSNSGRGWTPIRWSNLPSPSTKLFAGKLSTGQRYVVGTLVRDHGRRRDPLTIAVSAPGETRLSRLFRIRDAVFPGGPGESVKDARLAYPYAVEHDGKLWVVYSNDGGRNRNLNSAEMAVVPITSLAATRTP